MQWNMHSSTPHEIFTKFFLCIHLFFINICIIICDLLWTRILVNASETILGKSTVKIDVTWGPFLTNKDYINPGINK